MRALLVPLVAMALAGCASVPASNVPRELFADDQFVPPVVPITVADVFKLDDEMEAFASRHIRVQVERRGAFNGLFETLSTELKLDYDGVETRTAAQTFAMRRGNCISLVILTAAFAKHLDVPIRYQAVRGQSTWSRMAGIAFHSGHINLKIGARNSGLPIGYFDGMTIDFVAPGSGGRVAAQVIDERTLLAMYMNNRAAETLAYGDDETAYWWARAAVEQAPDYLPSLNTMSVIYLRHGQVAEAETVLRYVLDREPAEQHAMTNMTHVLTRLGRHNEARAWRARLEALEPYPPFYFLDEGNAALARGDAKAARALFEKELKRLPYNDEVHFAIARADLKRGDLREADKHLAMAQKYSLSPDKRDIYGAKRALLKARGTN
ncbi:MAG: tetratricopeptide repeat protein [Gammaproteobacteria bacterium]